MNAKNFTKWDAEDLLQLFGLESRRTVVERMLPIAGILAVGVAIGVGIGMLYAPKEGAKLREDLSNRLSEGLRGVRETLADLPSKIGVTSGQHESSSVSSSTSSPAKGSQRPQSRSSSSVS